MLDRGPAKNRMELETSHVRPLAAANIVVTRAGLRLVDIAEVSFRDEKLTAIIGPNGAGKTLLLKILAGVMAPDHGTVTWAGKAPVRAGYRKLSMVLQSPVLLRRTALANVIYGLRAAGVAGAVARQQALEALEQARLGHLAGAPARMLSGGEKQRLALARALAIQPEVLLLDEPVANLDPASALAIETMIDEARARGVTIVLVTHDLAQARRLADDAIFMHLGRIVERGEAVSFFEHPREPLAKAFINGEILT